MGRCKHKHIVDLNEFKGSRPPSLVVRISDMPAVNGQSAFEDTGLSKGQLVRHYYVYL